MVEKSKGEKTREHILKKTREVLISQGFYGTSISSIIEATGVKKGNLYYHFPSKEELGLAVLDDARQEFLSFLRQSLEGDDPLEEILTSAEAIFRELQGKDFIGGCLFGNTALEMVDSNPEFARVIRDVFSSWTEEYHRKLVEADGLGLPAGTMGPSLLARTLVALIEGWIMLVRVSKKEEDVQDCLTALRTILGK